jgi:hypothetical protein
MYLCTCINDLAHPWRPRPLGRRSVPLPQRMYVLLPKGAILIIRQAAYNHVRAHLIGQKTTGASWRSSGDCLLTRLVHFENTGLFKSILTNAQCLFLQRSTLKSRNHFIFFHHLSTTQSIFSPSNQAYQRISNINSISLVHFCSLLLQ